MPRKAASPADWDDRSSPPTDRMSVPRDSVELLLVRKTDPVRSTLFAVGMAGLAFLAVVIAETSSDY